jgi:hypothetical protein
MQVYQSGALKTENLMRPLLRIIIVILFLAGAGNLRASESVFHSLSTHDTIPDSQLLDNGRIWRNIYFDASNDQFLFTAELIPSEISIVGKVFHGIKLKYDISADELITPASVGGLIQLNKEMVDSFTLKFAYRTYKFHNLTIDSVQGLSGYCNLIYKGRSALYRKYTKELYRLSGQNVDQKFFLKTQLWLVIGQKAFPVKSRNDMLKAMGPKKDAVKEYISKNRVQILKNEPESFVPIIRYFDSLPQ